MDAAAAAAAEDGLNEDVELVAESRPPVAAAILADIADDKDESVDEAVEEQVEPPMPPRMLIPFALNPPVGIPPVPSCKNSTPLCELMLPFMPLWRALEVDGLPFCRSDINNEFDKASSALDSLDETKDDDKPFKADVEEVTPLFSILFGVVAVAPPL